MAISDAKFEQIKQNLPRVTIKGVIDADQKERTGYAFMAIDLLTHLPYHYTWGLSYPDVNALAMAQDGLIVIDAGPTQTIELIYDLLQKAMFIPGGFADWRILNMLTTAGYKVIRDFSNPDDDCYLIRTLRGHFAIYPPEVL